MRLRNYLSPVAFALGASIALGQAAPAAPAATKKDQAEPANLPAAEPAAGEVVELSPFQVTTDSFSGYYASQTLAGSRLRMNVDEVASSIQILTPEFMKDVGATSPNDLFLYTTSTESSGINGNFSDFSTGTTSTGDEASRINPQASQRVRGIAGADLTRNYFLTLIPSDRFNTELTEINRGANAILFGLGSPAGIVNTQLMTAKFKNSEQLRVDVDDQGSVRLEADVNQVIVPHRLAIRVAGVQDDKKYYQKPAFQDDHRFYAAFNARPWKNATIRGFVENGGRTANRPNTIPPASTIASWFDSQPLMVQRMRAVIAATPGLSLTVPDNYPLIYSPLAQTWRASNTSNTYLTATNISNDLKLAILRNAVIWHDNNTTNPRLIFHPNMSRQMPVIFLPGAVEPGGGPGGSAAVETNVPVIANPPLSLNPDGIGSTTAYNYFAPEQPWRTNPTIIPESLTDLSMFDFTRQMLSGNSAFQNDKWNHQNLSFEQTALNERVGIELVYDKQTYRRAAYVPFQNFTGIFVDLMQDYLGQTNPNLGRPFVADRVSMRTQQDERESFRSTVFGRFDPEQKWAGSRVARWLGKHTFTGMFSTYDQEQKNSSWGQYYQDATGGFIFSSADPLGSNRRKVNNFVYLGDSIIGAPSASSVRLTPLTDQKLWSPGRTVKLRTYNATTRTLEDVTLTTDAELEDISVDTQKIQTLATTWNGSFFNNNLIGLLGWRQDTVESERRQAVAGADLLADVSTLSTPASLLSRVDDKFRTTSWSVVGKLPESWIHLPWAAKLNAYYGESENFSLSATANDIYGGQLPSPAGSTKEFGVLLSLWDSKLVLRVNRYETQVANSLGDTKYGVLVNQGILKTYESLVEAVRYGNQGTTTPNYALVVQAADRMRALIPQATIVAAHLDTPTTGGDYARNDLPNLGDTQDVVGKGTEFELIYNPTKSWRIAFNAAQQTTVIDNYAPRIAELWSKFEPILGATGLVGNLRYFNDPNTAPPSFISEPAPAVGSPTTTVAQWIETNVMSPYRNQKLQEGRSSTEQREWRLNLVTNYTFTEGKLKGFGAGSAVRWQDGAVIGYPTTLASDGVTLIADITKPHVSPAITNIDAWVRYNRRLFKGRIDWTVELRVVNLNHTAQDLIPVRSALTADYRVAQYRVGPPRVWSISNTVRF